MNSTPEQLKIFLSLFAVHVPTLLVCLVAGVVIIINWKLASPGSLWALLAFGLAFILCFVMPIGQTLLQHWVFQSGEREARMWAFSAFAIVGSVLQALIYALLLAAVFAGRQTAK
ncbi:hypothetical protein CfE428DRAFT_3947 [Chthoniobacter flavus Ellin428]|uniref:Uncharacterized protein n=1 Tax=Chthoniobacter flavus Ellin428 TaxID=497964 RepID=B4D4V9_9BACT|nr:hypothetical protein [Chthoniobacter flavus]EDY18562.1 hypothetical protein CfE428DRAFT_3947 [Chthoniobacter flavus Ellin428]TCO90983.1 hypothetical protein EV701_109133 [Chthoniobacter flavus]